jgi:Spy/CpxP family protein refolding chaperone
VIVDKENADMIKQTIVALSIAMTVAAALPFASMAADESAGATPSTSGRSWGGGGHKGQFEDIKAVLTPEQTKQFEQIVQEARENNRPIYQKMAEMKKTAQDSDPKFQELKQQMSDRKKATKEKLMSILTPDQKIQLKKNHDEKKKAGAPADDANKAGTN